MRRQRRHFKLCFDRGRLYIVTPAIGVFMGYTGSTAQMYALLLLWESKCMTSGCMTYRFMTCECVTCGCMTYRLMTCECVTCGCMTCRLMTCDSMTCVCSFIDLSALILE